MINVRFSQNLFSFLFIKAFSSLKYGFHLIHSRHKEASSRLCLKVLNLVAEKSFKFTDFSKTTMRKWGTHRLHWPGCLRKFHKLQAHKGCLRMGVSLASLMHPCSNIAHLFIFTYTYTRMLHVSPKNRNSFAQCCSKFWSRVRTQKSSLRTFKAIGS